MDRHKDKNDTQTNTTHNSHDLCNTYQGKAQGENRGAPEEWVVTVSISVTNIKTRLRCDSDKIKIKLDIFLFSRTDKFIYCYIPF